MGVMVKDINFGLFLLILGTLIAFAGFTAYYQSTFTNLSLEYHSKLGELDKVSSTLQNEKARLNLTSYQLKIKAEREADLGTKYEDIRAQKERLEKEKTQLETDLSKTRGELNEKSGQLTIAQGNLAARETELNQANTQIIALDSKVVNLKDDIKNKEAEISRLCEKLKAAGQTCD